MKLGPVARACLGALLALSAVLFVMNVRALLEARALVRQGELALRAGELDRAVTSYRLAARWDAPLNTYAREALEKLEYLAREAERSGAIERALDAYRAIHASVYATRGFFETDAELVSQVDGRIAELMAQTARREGTLGGERAGAQVAREELSALHAARTRPLFVLVAWLGFMSWVGGAGVFILFGLDKEGRLVRHVARPSALFVVVGWLAFALGLRAA